MAFILFSFWCDLCLCWASVCCALYFWYQYKFNYWNTMGVPGPKPVFPFGNIKQMALGKEHFGEVMAKIYKETNQHPFVGIYLMYQKVLLINDLDLIKTILVKDFIHFTDHGIKFNEKIDQIVAGLFLLNGNDWKRLRTQLTPAFTSSKIKGMFETIASCGKEMQAFLGTRADAGGTIDAKDVVGKFTSDVIVSVAFGIDCNSFTSPDPVFKKMGTMVFDADLEKSLSQFFGFFAPSVQKILNLRMIDKRVSDFFYETIGKTVKFREENNIQRSDIMHLLIRLKNHQFIEDEDSKIKRNVPTLTLEELTAVSFGFFVAGFETSSTLLSFTLFELARHPNLQEKLVQEIDEVLERHSGNICYKALEEMAYMSQVIQEGLRLYPSLPILFRICTKRYVIPGTEVVIQKGTPVIIPIWGIHRDPAIFPEPETFDPDRFSAENTAARHPYSLLSFGEGPRICIGKRFAMLQIRIALTSILKCYQLRVVDDKPIEISKKTFFLVARNSIMLQIKRRSPST